MKRIVWACGLALVSGVLMAGGCGDGLSETTCCGVGCDDVAAFDATSDSVVAADTSDSWGGYAPVEATVTPQAGDMDPTTGSITGSTCGADSIDRPEANVRVYIQSGDGVIIAETMTDSDGHFELCGVPPGTWFVIVEKGPFYGTHTVVVEAEMTTEVTHRLCMA